MAFLQTQSLKLTRYGRKLFDPNATCNKWQFCCHICFQTFASPNGGSNPNLEITRETEG